MAKIRNLYRIGCNPPKKKIKKNLTQGVANRKTVVSLTYKPTTKPKPMNKLERYCDAIMLVVTYIGGIGVCLCILRWLIHYLTL